MTGGLAPGEWVVTAGVNKLREGEAVRPYEGSGATRRAGACAETAAAR